MTLLDKVFELVAKMQTAITSLEGIKTALIKKGVDVPEGTPQSEYVNKIAEIEDSGAAYERGYNKGHTDGRNAEKNDFWDKYQNNGKRDHYLGAFSGIGWEDSIFRPKYNIAPYNAAQMFENSNITDLKARLAECNVTLDFSKAALMTYMFRNSKITNVGVIDTSAETENTVYIFNRAMAMVSIEKLIIKSNGNNKTGTSSFNNMTALKNIVIEGKFGNGDVNFQWSTELTVESAKSIILALMDFAGTANEFKYTVYFADEVWGKLAAEGNTSPNGNSWADYISNKKWNA